MFILAKDTIKASLGNIAQNR